MPTPRNSGSASTSENQDVQASRGLNPLMELSASAGSTASAKASTTKSYKIRFTRRKPRSTWSAINIKRATELSKLGYMHATGLAAFEKRDEKRSGIYAYEQRKGAALPPAYEKQFRKDQKAWEFFQSRPAWYRRTSAWWVISAKKEETKLRRLEILIACSSEQKNIPSLNRPTPQGKTK